MIKKRMIYILVLLMFIIIVLILFMQKSKKKNKIEDSVKSIKVSNHSDLEKYYKDIVKYMKPEKLLNFSDFTDMYLQDYTEKATGYTVLDDLKYDAYVKLFNQLFNKRRENFDDCPVTENFKNKFKTNLFKCFNFSDLEDSSVSCSVDWENKLLSIDEAGNFKVGEPGYIYYHHFHYTLDEEGNIDDVIFDYTEE